MNHKANIANTENWCVYLILCSNGAWYCGISNCPAKRFTAHIAGKGARYTRMHKPVAIRLVATGLTRSEAARNEYATKQLSHAEKSLLWQQAQPLTIITDS